MRGFVNISQHCRVFQRIFKCFPCFGQENKIRTLSNMVKPKWRSWVFWIGVTHEMLSFLATILHGSFVLLPSLLSYSVIFCGEIGSISNTS